MKRFLRILLPGIRMQLSLLTLVLVALLMVILTVWLIDQQKKTLRRELSSRTEPILESFRNIILEQTQLEKSLTQMESMRDRIRKTGRSKSYYDQYFPEKHLVTAEKEIRSQLRSADGSSVSEKEAAAFINARKKIITTRINRQEQVNWNPANWLSEGMIKEVRQVQRSSRVTRARNIDQEKQAIRHTVHAESRDKLGLFNFDTSLFRIQAFQQNGRLLFDTATLEKNNLSPVNRLRLDRGDQQKIFSDFTEALRQTQQKKPDAALRLSEFESLSLDSSVRYADSFRSIHRDEESSSRAKTVLSAYLSSDDTVKDRVTQYDQAEENILQQIRNTADQLRGRIVELKRDQPNHPPAKDSQFRDLYNRYNTLVNEKKNLAQALIPTVNKFTEELTRNEKQQAQSRLRITELKKNIADIQTTSHDSKKNTEEEQKTIASQRNDLQKQLDDENENLASLQDKARILKYRSENWNYAREEFIRDSFQYLADVALYDQIVLRYRHDSLSLRDYLRSPQEREKQNIIWAGVRNWITAGKNELNLPTKIGGKAGITLMKNGVLTKTRSEAEEQMWLADTTSARDLAHRILYEDSYAGFLRFTADLTDYQAGFQQERNRLNLLLIATGILGALLAFFLASVFVRRIRRVSEQAAQVGIEGNLDIRFSPKGWDEISLLQKSLNQMLGSIKEGEEVRSQMNAAGEVQKRMLPDHLPAGFSAKLDTAMYYRAMSNIGGDYYDFIQSGEDRLAICIGDVSNHGIGPALVMSNLSAQIKLLVDLGSKSPSKILGKLNELLLANTPDDMFVTFFLAFYDPTDRLLNWSCAGHNDGILIRRDGKVEILSGGGLPLGMDENDFFLSELQSGKTVIRPGDLLFLFTDGLTEAKNSQKKFFGFQRLLALLQANYQLTSREIVQKIAEVLAAFTGTPLSELDLDDDIAMIAVKF